MKTIFVTGGTGTIGKFFIPALLKTGRKIFSLSRNPPANTPSSPLQWVAGDLQNPDSYRLALTLSEEVIHMAAVTHTNHIARYHQVNVEGTRKLVEACEQEKIRRLVLISTSSISPEGGPYSRSKREAERLVSQSPLDWVILRVAEVYGASPKGAVDRCLRQIESLPAIPVLNTGAFKMSPVPISDVVNAMLAILDHPELTKKIYNLCGPQSFTYTELIEELMRLKKIRKPKIPVPLFLFKTALNTLTALSRDFPMAADQIPRLFSAKSNDLTPARQDFGFAPKTLRQALNL